MQLILCYVFGLVLISVSVVPSENCPEEYDPICRTDYRYRVSHDWIWYANASSGDGIRWRVLVDQHDYQNIFGSFLFPAGKWKELDADGDGINVSTVTKFVVLIKLNFHMIIYFAVGTWKWRHVYLSSSGELLQAVRLKQLVFYSSPLLL